MDVSENIGTPKSSILIGSSIINHPFWGVSLKLTAKSSALKGDFPSTGGIFWIWDQTFFFVVVEVEVEGLCYLFFWGVCTDFGLKPVNKFQVSNYCIHYRGRAVSLSTLEPLAYFIPSFRVAGKGLSVRVYRLKNMNTFATG